MLEVKDLHVNYGAVHALNGISLHVDDGEIVSLIGANGAGKTTVFSLLPGVYQPPTGSFFLDGEVETSLSVGMPELPQSKQSMQAPEQK